MITRFRFFSVGTAMHYTGLPQHPDHDLHMSLVREEWLHLTLCVQRRGSVLHSMVYTQPSLLDT